MTKLTLADINNLQNETTVVSQINNNSALTETALENTLSRDGTSPNEMLADLDMNSNRILNLPAPTTDTQPIRKKEFDQALFGDVVYESVSTSIYDSYTELSSDTVPTSVTGVYLNGYYTRGDGGNAYWKRSASEPSHGLKFSVLDEDGNTVWFEYGNTVINPLALGAKGDGVTSCGTVFADIGNAIGSGYYNILYIPGGNSFLLDSGALDINKAPNGFTMYGDGESMSTIIEAPGSDGRPIRIRNFDGIKISGITFLSTTSNNNMDIMNCSDVLVENCTFKDSTNYGLGVYEDVTPIDTTGSAQSGTHTLHYGTGYASTRSVTFTTGVPTTANATSHGLTYGSLVKFTTTGTLPAPLLENTPYLVAGVTPNTFGVYPTPLPCNNVIVRYNKFINNGSFGFEQFPKVRSNHTELYGNYFKDCGADPLGVAADGDPAAAKPGQSYSLVRVYDNVVDGSYGGGIWVGLFETVEMFRNEFKNCKNAAIALSLTDHSAFTDDMPPRAHATIENNFIHYDDDYTTTIGGSMGIASNQTNTGPVLIKGNKFVGGDYDFATILVRTTSAVPNLSIVDNVFEKPPALSVYLSNELGDAPVKPLVRGNTVINTDLTKQYAGRMDFIGCDQPVVVDNYFENVGRIAINLNSSVGGAIVDRNIINGYNVDGLGTTAAITVTDSAFNYYYIRNNMLYTNDGTPYAFISGSSSNPKFILGNNVSDSWSTIQTLGTVARPTAAIKPFFSVGQGRWFEGNAAPSTGTWYINDIVWNNDPGVTEWAGWICISGGTPGTWKGFGVIES